MLFKHFRFTLLDGSRAFRISYTVVNSSYALLIESSVELIKITYENDSTFDCAAVIPAVTSGISDNFSVTEQRESK
jgi:hypothetical protein